ncbi:cAMP-activated global transcriptional regulator CRP [Natronospira bacteriovora]|uniref:cAMP-activated global transcriptional regulator CRP n=1 Tax=Natronospira bacteriovora TaxID=3069753 RepID=A0ABU0W8J6_9GAMM|nr:cAMP-activated global transcriptional regulator CRP [Natronospira sp. AB-CW4]MDQ2070355.1 cAMP-activated global transcriptional regulator CRP [Natronospira sp. AB-CW4]
MNQEISLTLQAEDMDWFLSHCHVRRLPARKLVIHAGAAPDSLYFIVEGSVTVLIEDEEGNEAVVAYLHENEFFGEMGLFDAEATRSAFVRTRSECQIAEISYARFQRLCSQKPEILFAVARQLARRLQKTTRRLGDLVFLDVTGRVAAALLEMSREPDAMTHPEGIQIQLSRQELGRLVGCSREMAGRVLKALEEQGLVRAEGKKIIVLGAGPGVDSEGLASECGGRD